MGQFSEKRWPAVPKQNLTGDGKADGSIEVLDTTGFYVGMLVSVSTDGTNDNAKSYKVTQVASSTILYVRNPNDSFKNVADMTAYTVGGGATITADKQKRTAIVSDEVIRAVYSDEPAVAFRVMNVDSQGNSIGSITDSNGVNRLAVDASLTATGLTIDLDALSPPTQANPDNVLIAGSEDGTKTGFKRAATINANNQLKVGDTNTFLPAEFDAYTVDSKNGDGNPTQITYSQLGSPVMVVTLTYDIDGDLQSATRA